MVPELASRDHGRKLLPLIRQTLADAGLGVHDLDGVAYTAGPGLVGALLVGAGVARSLAAARPAREAAQCKALQAPCKKVGMGGGGVNGAPALTQADVGSGIGAGTDVAMESADVVLMKSDPYDIVGAIELSRATLRKMHQNLWWAVGYNVIAFPLAAGVLYPFVLSPEIAALSMSGSTLIVAINALMLKRTKLAGIHQPGKSAAPAVAAIPQAEQKAAAVE